MADYSERRVAELLVTEDREKVSSLVDSFTNLADSQGLLDLAYTTIPSPIGDLLLVATSRGILRIGWEDEEDVLADLSEKVSPRILELPKRLDEPRRELDQYFSGKRKVFDLPLDFSLSQGFRRAVLESTFEKVRFGQTVSYSEVAENAMRPKAVRAAASALANNPIPIIVPCHRILRKGGGLGGYAGGLDRKVRLLQLEGVEVN